MFKFLKVQKERNRLRFFTYSVYFILLFLIGLFFVGILINVYENKGNIQESYIFNKRPTVVITGSMEPTIKVNGIVILEPVTLQEVEIGDIIRYTSYQGYSVMHRVISKNDSYVVTKGDANNSPDSFVVMGEQITGRVIEIHNEYAEILSFIFGTFEYGNIGGSILRACLGFIVLGICIAIIVIIFILIFEMITTTYFFKKYNKQLIESSNYWQKSMLNIEDQNNILQQYLEKLNHSNIFKKIFLVYQFRRYYNGLCNIEKEVNITTKRLNNLTRFL